MRKKLALLMASLFLIVGTAWAQTPVLKLMSGQIGNSYPYALSDEDASKVFALEDLTVAVKVNASSFTHNARMALFCTSDPTQNANTSAKGIDSHYVAYGLSGTNDSPSKGAVGYLASCLTGDRFTKGGVVANSQEVVLVYVINPSKKTYKMYINGVENGSWVGAHADGFKSGYEIATPKMVKADYSNAKIYIGGGVKAGNSSFETFNGTITGVEVYNGALTAEQVKNVFPETFKTGKMYALKEVSTGLYLDIQTLGINEKNAGYTTNNISLNVNPCVIYFESGDNNNWKIKNINGGYVYIHDQDKGDGKIRNWNASISTGDKSNSWKFTEVETGVFKISRETDNKYIGTDAPVANQPLFCDMTDNAKILKFTLVEYTSADLNPQGYYALKLKDENNAFYFNFTAKDYTKATLQTTPTYFYALPSANEKYLLFQNKDNAEQFLGHPAGGWSTTYDCKLWEISEADEDGLVTISRHADTGQDGGKEMGTNKTLVKELKLYTNVKNSKRWAIEGTFNLATNGTVVNSNYEFTSGKIYYYNPCNKLRFTLTESGAYYQNGKKRMSFDEFYLYDAQGKEVKLTANNVSGNNNKTYAGMFDRTNDTFAFAPYESGTEDDYFEILLPKEVDLGGAFSFKFVTENTTMNAKAFKIETLYQKINTIVYNFAVDAPQDATPTVTYNGEAVAAGQTFEEGEFDIELFNATDIPGYTWSVEVDDENATITILYSQAEIVENPQAVVALINRIGGAGTSDKFKFVLDPSINSKQETFVLGAEEGKILIKGTTISAITTGLGWYLNNIAHINIAWNSLNEKTVSGEAYADLSKLPLPTTAETHSTDAKYRYYLNYCTFGYSMTSWTWKRWQQEIDWMALHGINMPLQIVGLEEVWRKFLTMKDANGNSKYNYTDVEAKAFVAGPAYTAWWGMNNLEGFGGTGTDGWGGVQDDAWYKRQQALATQILTLQRQLGMEPVLPGFSGMVPSNFGTKNSIATNNNGGNWGGFTRPHIVSPTSDRFAGIAADYYQCLAEVMGTSQYYSMDPFHEGGGSASDGDYTIIYNAMEAAKPGSQWVIQQWQWYGNSQKKSLYDVPAGKLIVLDLFSDGRPEFDKYGYNGYAPQNAVFCAIPNFGGRSGLMGRLQNVTDNYFTYKAKYSTIKGIGTAPEAIEQTPVTYDLIYQLPWMDSKPNVSDWVANYSVARYGKNNAIVKQAWSLLREGPLGYGADAIQGPVEDVWAARPNLDATPASSWGTTLNGAGGTYTKEKRQKLVDAVYKLISQENALELTEGSTYESNYLYDIVEFGGAVMADYAYDLLKGIKEAKDASNTALYEARRDAFLQLILDMDAFRGTNLNFRLGKWTQEARDAAKEAKTYGATIADEDWYEFKNARTILTTWGDQGQNGNGAWNNGLKDYSYRSWQGLLADYYYPRWEYYFNNGCTHPNGNAKNYFYFEWNWAHGLTHEVGQTAKSTTRLSEGATGYSYTREPEGNTVELAKSMLAKYIIPVKCNDGTTYYAYRTFTTDLAGKATVNTTSSSSVDFTKFFNVPADAVVTGDFINNSKQSANIKAVPTVGAEGTYTGTITIADGTVLQNFTVVLTEAQFNGYYNISWQNGETEVPMFIGYNEENDDWVGEDHKGYKMLGTGVYTTESEADKVFHIVPQEDGYSISAQGKNLVAINFNGWNHLQFSDDKNAAGVYNFIEQTDLENVYKIQGVGEDDGVGKHNDYLQVYNINDSGKLVVGPNPVGSAHNFKLVPVTEYTLTVPASGYAAVCLPFNVVLPEGVEAYDVTTFSEKTPVADLLVKIANEGDILSAGTPVILKANAGSCVLTITKENNDAITSSDGSLLRGNFVKQTLEIEETKKFILNEAGEFELVSSTSENPANSCWIASDIADENASVEDGQIVIDGWTFKYSENVEGRITLKDVVTEGGADLVIGSEYTVKGEKKTVVGISPEFMHGNENLTSITLPATMTNLGFREIEPMFEGSYAGQPGDNGGTYEGSTAQGTVVGKDREFEFPTNKETGIQYQVNGTYAWRLTLDVNIDPNKNTSFNNYGSAIVSSKSNSLADYYDGYMQIYLWKDLQHIVVKIDNNDDRYSYSLPELDAEGKETGNLETLNHFKFELEHDGAGGYQVVIYYDDGRAKMYSISAGQSNLEPFSSLWYSLPEGISVDVKFEKLRSEGLFVDCTKLQKIIVDPANPTFKSCDHGVLYDKNGYYVMRIPEGSTDHYEIPSKVVKLYAGSFHGVKADIVLHSNPQIGVVKGHEAAVKNAKFYLSLDDIDNTIVSGETGFGGARDFISTNNNTYQSARYKRAPLAPGVYGTIILPFAPTNALTKYDFFKFIGGDATSLTFSQVDELEAQTPYLYKLKETPGNMTTEDGLDVFETLNGFEVKTLAKYDPNDEKPGGARALGAYVNYYIETKNYPNSGYYYYKTSEKAFFKVTKKLTYRPYRVIFVVTPEGQAAQAPSRLSLRMLDGTTTDIDASLVEGMETPVYYDLSGRRVLNPGSGVYIVNGKKVFVK